MYTLISRLMQNCKHKVPHTGQLSFHSIEAHRSSAESQRSNISDICNMLFLVLLSLSHTHTHTHTHTHMCTHFTLSLSLPLSLLQFHTHTRTHTRTHTHTHTHTHTQSENAHWVCACGWVGECDFHVAFI